MNYCKYIPIDVLNGRGTRCTLFVSGCEHHCKGCYNQSTWRVNSGFLFDKDMEDRIITDLQDLKIPRRGVSLSGGDPLLPHNLEAVLHLCKRVKSETTKDIWMWTGYTLEALSNEQREVVKYVDVLVDGKFELDKTKPIVPFRGSYNQRIIEFTSGSVPKGIECVKSNLLGN